MPNLWRRFKDLLPDDPLLIGTIRSNPGDGTRVVELLDGGTLRASGSVAVGDKVFVQGGRITGGDAPDLPQVDIEI